MSFRKQGGQISGSPLFRLRPGAQTTVFIACTSRFLIFLWRPFDTYRPSPVPFCPIPPHLTSQPVTFRPIGKPTANVVSYSRSEKEDPTRAYEGAQGTEGGWIEGFLLEVEVGCSFAEGGGSAHSHTHELSVAPVVCPCGVAAPARPLQWLPSTVPGNSCFALRDPEERSSPWRVQPRYSIQVLFLSEGRRCLSFAAGSVPCSPIQARLRVRPPSVPRIRLSAGEEGRIDFQYALLLQ